MEVAHLSFPHCSVQHGWRYFDEKKIYFRLISAKSEDLLQVWFLLSVFMDFAPKHTAFWKSVTISEHSWKGFPDSATSAYSIVRVEARLRLC